MNVCVFHTYMQGDHDRIREQMSALLQAVCIMWRGEWKEETSLLLVCVSHSGAADVRDLRPLANFLGGYRSEPTPWAIDSFLGRSAAQVHVRKILHGRVTPVLVCRSLHMCKRQSMHSRQLFQHCWSFWRYTQCYRSRNTEKKT